MAESRLRSKKETLQIKNRTRDYFCKFCDSRAKYQINAYQKVFLKKILKTFGSFKELLYLCIVFFIVLDLRLTKVWGLGGAPFFILSPFSAFPSVSRDNKNKKRKPMPSVSYSYLLESRHQYSGACHHDWKYLHKGYTTWLFRLGVALLGSSVISFATN